MPRNREQINMVVMINNCFTGRSSLVSDYNGFWLSISKIKSSTRLE